MSREILFFRETITHLDNSKLPMEKRGKMEKDAQIMIKMLPPQVEQEKKMQKNGGGDGYASNGMQADTKLNNGVEFDFTEREGRFARTNRNIKVGEEILVERAVCAVLMERFSKSHCQHCMERYSLSKFHY